MREGDGTSLPFMAVRFLRILPKGSNLIRFRGADALGEPRRRRVAAVSPLPGAAQKVLSSARTPSL
jgi:hypothetical protein